MDDSSGEDSTDEDCPDKGGLEYSTEDKIGINLGEEDDLANYGGDNTDGQFSTAITKIQIHAFGCGNSKTCTVDEYTSWG